MTTSVHQILLQEIQIVINKFVCSANRTRIQISVLQNSVEDGTLALPNVRLYCHAAMISAVGQWWNYQDERTGASEQLTILIPLSEWMLRTE